MIPMGPLPSRNEEQIIHVTLAGAEYDGEVLGCAGDDDADAAGF